MELEALAQKHNLRNGWPRNMFLFTNANYLLPYTGAGSGVRRALEYDPDAIFSNGVDQREITHSANEFIITIPRKTDQVTNQVAQNYDLVIQNTTKLTQNHDLVNDQPVQNTTKLKLSKKQQDIRNYYYYRRNYYHGDKIIKIFPSIQIIRVYCNCSPISGSCMPIIASLPVVNNTIR